MKTAQNSVLLFSALALVSANAFAANSSSSSSATASAANVSETSLEEEKSTLERLSEAGLRASWGATFYGPSLGRMGTRLTDDQGELTDSRLFFYNSVKLGYQATAKVKAFVNPRFNVKAAEGADFSLLNPRFGASAGGIASSGNLSFAYLDATVEAGLTKGSRDAGMLFAPGSTQLTQYSVGRWTLGSWSWFRSYVWEDATAKKSIGFGVTPFLSFQVSPKVVASVEYDMAAKHVIGAGLAADGTYLAPRMSIDVLPKLNVSPYVKFFPAGRVTLDSTTFNLDISGAIL